MCNCCFSCPPQFLRRQQVLQLYRRILRAIREVPTEDDRHYLKQWAREEFKRNKDATEEVRNKQQSQAGALSTLGSILSAKDCSLQDAFIL
uniref:LYR motif-containing protein 2 n=1 Tax=Crocodylus porosus TaxID=8502 RepID=A0A7M4FFT7_CROPO